MGSLSVLKLRMDWWSGSYVSSVWGSSTGRQTCVICPSERGVIIAIFLVFRGVGYSACREDSESPLLFIILIGGRGGGSFIN